MPIESRFASMLKFIRQSVGINDKSLLVKEPYKWRSTIGIVGINPLKVASLNKEIVIQGNEIGLLEDQHFPEIVSVGISTNDIRLLEGQVDICRDYGCDIIALAEKTNGSGLNNSLEQRFHLPVLSMEGSMKKFAISVLESSLSTKPRRPDILYHGDEGKMFEQILEDKKSRAKRIRKTESHGGYPVLNEPFVGIVGGAGPLASAIFSEDLAKTQTPFVHCSVNSAPGKHNFEMNVGPSYIEHYRSTISFFKNLGAHSITIPCNTAHKRLSEFCGDSIDRVVDIRKSVLDVNRNEEGFILLGTSRTVGIGLPEGEVGLYEDLRKNYPDQGPFFTPSKEQHTKIMTAIFDVKAGNFLQAKEKITSVVGEIRKEYGYHRVILGCTELPLPFSELERAELNLIDPAQNMAQVVKKEIDKEVIRRVEKEEESKKESDSDVAKLRPSSATRLDGKEITRDSEEVSNGR